LYYCYTLKNYKGILLSLLVIAIIITALVYGHQKNERVDAANTDITFTVVENTLSVLNAGKVTQTISLNSNAVNALGVIPGNVDKFITNLDVNFDGHNDIAVFASTGYAGINNYYDFYIYNPQTNNFEKNVTLVEISNPAVDAAKKQVKSNYRSGPVWYTDVYKLDGALYTKISGGGN